MATKHRTKHRTGYLFKRGNTYYLEYMIEGKRVKQSLDTTVLRTAQNERDRIMKPLEVASRKEAIQAVVNKLESATQERIALDEEDTPPLTVSDAWEEFERASNRPDAGPATLKQYSYQFKTFVEWLNSEYPQVQAMRDVTKDIAQEFAAYLSASARSANTFNKYTNLLDLVFRTLADKARIQKSPWDGIGHKRVVSHSRRELTVEELRKVCQSATGELRTLFALGIYTGLRLGDCATLRWGEVDTVRALIRRIPSKTARRNPKPVVIPIHSALKAILAEIPSPQRKDYVLPATATKYFNQPYSLVTQIQAHFETCGIRTQKPGTGPANSSSKTKDGDKKKIRAVVEVGFHSLRHTFVSLCRGANAPLSVVEAIVGHSNPAMTRHYTHVGDLAASQAVAALPELMDMPTNAPKLLPPADPVSLLSTIEQILARSSDKSFKKDRSEILRLIHDSIPRSP